MNTGVVVESPVGVSIECALVGDEGLAGSGPKARKEMARQDDAPDRRADQHSPAVKYFSQLTAYKHGITTSTQSLLG